MLPPSFPGFSHSATTCIKIKIVTAVAQAQWYRHSGTGTVVQAQWYRHSGTGTVVQAQWYSGSYPPEAAVHALLRLAACANYRVLGRYIFFSYSEVLLLDD